MTAQTSPLGRNRAAALLAVTLALGPLTACGASRSTSPYAPQREQARNPLRAQELTQKAVAALPDDPEKAERLLREALAADLYHGPAHNNLGVLYLHRGQLYEAAGEFEWARKLMPGHPDPRLNLGLALERAGRIGEALDAYASALEVYPDHLPSLQALARAQLRHDRTDPRTAPALDAIALRSTDPAWRNWARMQQLNVAAQE